MKKLYSIISICLFSVILASCGDNKIDSTDFENNLAWSSKSPTGISWFEAADYCDNLTEREKSDWRLPTIDEIRTLIQNCPATMTGGLCTVTDECLSSWCRNEECFYNLCDYSEDGRYSKLGDAGNNDYFFWSSSPYSSEYYSSEYAWVIWFASTNVSTFLKSEKWGYTRCVRSQCDNGYFWNNGKCETAPTRTADCTGLPANASWNSVSSITQTWNGSDWVPATIGNYNEETSEIKCRFRCDHGYGWNGEICEKTYTDLITGLMWSPISFDSMDWYYAMDYCDNLSLFGYNDWHLPTISELRTLIRNCSNTETGGECGVTDTCLSFEECFNDACGGCYEADYLGKYSKLDENRPLWSSSTQSDDADFAWYVYFRYPLIDRDYKSGNIPVRCVRSE